MEMTQAYWVIRHKPTQRLMPARMSRSGGRGWSHWDPTDPDYAGFGRAPRLFDDPRAAANARTLWLKGAHEWSNPRDPQEDATLKVRKRDRKPEDVEVVPVTLTITLTGMP
jgi:hypothetical protein